MLLINSYVIYKVTDFITTKTYGALKKNADKLFLEGGKSTMTVGNENILLFA